MPVLMHFCLTMSVLMTRVLSVRLGLFFYYASLSDIQTAVYWSTPNTFISCYLEDVPRGEAAFASAVFKAVSKI